MKKTIPSLALIGVCVYASLAGVSPAEPSLARAEPPGCPPAGCAGQAVIIGQGQPWIVNGVTYTVSWATMPHGYGGDLVPHVEIDVHVDNRGNDVAHYPDPSAVYNGDAVAVAGWTQPDSGAEVAAGHSGDFRSAFPLRVPAGTLQVRVMAYTGDVQEFGYWTGTVA